MGAERVAWAERALPKEALDVGPLLEGAPISMPERWRKVPVCDRPNRWREGVSQEECDAAAGRPTRKKAASMVPGELSPSDLGTTPAAPPSTNYKDVVPQLISLQDFIEANQISDVRRRLVVVKYYSPQCKACLKIAAKYRRLALDLADDVDCFEVDTVASRPLVKFMNVTKVPSIQIFDPAGIVRLGDSPCMPQDFDRVRHKIDVARTSIKRRRKIHAWVGTSYGDELTRINEERRDVPRGSRT